MNILLIAGHGDGDVGAVGCGYKEADLTREVVKLLKSQLDRFADVEIAIVERNWCKYFKNGGYFDFTGYDYVLEIHFNSCVNDTKGNGKTTGTEIYITTSEKSHRVETNIVEGISSIGFRNRGVKRKNWTVIKKIKSQGISAALLEVCFIDDLDDMKLYQAKKNEIVKAIAGGIIKGFGLKATDELAEACEVLASAGIMKSPEYWAKGKGYSDEYTVQLIKNIAEYVKGGTT